MPPDGFEVLNRLRLYNSFNHSSFKALSGTGYVKDLRSDKKS